MRVATIPTAGEPGVAKIAGEAETAYDLVLVYAGSSAAGLANRWMIGGLLNEVE